MKSLTLALATGAFSCPQDQDAKGPSKKLILEAGTHPIGDLITKSALALGRTYLVGKGELESAAQPDVRIQQRLELDERGIEEVVGQLLHTAGFVMTIVDSTRGIYEWIAIQGPQSGEIQARAPRFTPDEIAARPTLKMWVTTVVPMKHAEPGVVVNGLRPLLANGRGPTGLVLGTLGQQRSLMVGGFVDQIAKVLQTVREVDQPPAQVAPTVVERLVRLEQRVTALEAQGKTGK